MSRPAYTTTNGAAATLLRAYAAAQIAEGYGEDEAPAGILTAIVESGSPSETGYLGCALLVRHHRLSDPPYRLGGKLCDPRLTEIAALLGVTP